MHNVGVEAEKRRLEDEETAAKAKEKKCQAVEKKEMERKEAEQHEAKLPQTVKQPCFQQFHTVFWGFMFPTVFPTVVYW